MKHTVKAILVLIGILSVPVILLGWVYHSSRSYGIPVGQKFPLLHLTTLDGRNVKIDRKTLLVFFHATCPYCQKQLVNLEQLDRRYHSEDFLILAVSLDDRTTTGAFLDHHRPSYLVVMDVDNAFATILEEKAIPAIYLIDETGIVRYRRNGYRELEIDDRIVRTFVMVSEVKDDNPCRCESE